MARRNGRKGDWLATDDYTGATCYGSDLQRDYWGQYARKPLLRNLQEIAQPLGDPYPIPFYNGPDYELTSPCSAEIAPLFVGLTTVKTNFNNAAIDALDLNPSIPNMSVGCTLVIR